MRGNMTNGIKRTREEIEEILEKFGYTLVDEYIPEPQKERKVIVQDESGYKYDVSLNSIMMGQSPDFVNICNPYTLENISLWLSLNNSEFILCEGNIYKGKEGKLKFFHKTSNCQEIFYARWGTIFRGDGCSVCHGSQVGNKNSVSYLRPSLLLDWHPENTIKPNELTSKSRKKVYWICSECGYGKDFEWYRSPKDKGKCPACLGRIITDLNRLSVRFPEIAKEWDYEKNSDTPDDVSYSKNDKRWWICNNGHSYYSSINSRTNGKGRFCKRCSDARRESKIANELKRYLIDNYNAKDEYKVFKNPETGNWLPYDIYIPYGEDSDLNGFYVEVHWDQHYEISYFHKLSAKRNGTTPEEVFKHQKHLDRLKRRFARKNGTYIEIDLRKIKTTQEAVEYIDSIIPHFSLDF